MHRLFFRRSVFLWTLGIVLVLTLVGMLLRTWLTRPILETPWKLNNAADCAELLLQKGIAVSEPPLIMQHITLPVQVNDTYEQYLRLQDRQQLPLREYAGGQADYYVFLDASDGQTRIALILCEGRLIAADQTSGGISPSCEALF